VLGLFRIQPWYDTTRDLGIFSRDICPVFGDGSGQPLAMGLWRMGTRPMAPAVERGGFAIGSYLRDGANTRAYVRGQIVDGSDPEGLFLGIVGGLMTALDAGSNASDQLDEAATGLNTIFGLGEMLGGYAFDQMMDADWASDWEAPDNVYSQSGIGNAAMYGLFDEVEEADGPGMAKFVKGKPRRLNAWKPSRRHGDAVGHWDKMRDAGHKLVGRGVNPRTIRTNQALVDKDGNMISNMRPDVQGVDADGRVHIVEVANSQTGASVTAKGNAYADALRRSGQTGTYTTVVGKKTFVRQIP